MIKLELRNTKTQKSVFVDTRGAVFGREGGDADIKLADQGVSKKHARIYARKGEWFLEDLNSANGTYVDAQRISQAVLLEPGASFSLSRQQFEVVQIVEDEPEVTQAPSQQMMDDAGSDEDHRTDERDQQEEEEEQQDEEPQDEEEHQETVPPNPPARRPEARGGSRAAAPAVRGGMPDERRPLPPARSAARAQQEVEADDAPEGFDVGYFMKAVPKAIAYYLAAIPLMVVNPVGFVRKSIDQQKVPAMGKMQLIAYAFPPYLAMVALSFVGALLFQIRAGTVSIGGILPIVPLISAVVGAVVAGFVWHPVLEWIVSKLGGDSDAKSRSNMFVAAMTAVALLGVPALVGGALSFIPLTIVGLVPVLLQAFVSVVMLFTYYAWFKHFGVMKWFQYGLLALAGLSVLGVVGSSIGVITSSFSGGGSAGVEMASGSGDSADSDEVPAEWKSALEAAEASGNAEMVANVRAQIKNAMAAMKASENAQAAASANAEAAQQQAEASEKTMAATAKATDTAAKVESASTQAAANVEVAAKKETVKLDMPPPPVAAKVAPVRGMAYPEYKKKLTAIETAIGEDPTLLRRIDGLLPLYEDLYRARWETEARISVAQKKAERWQSPVNAHLRDAEVYKETQDLVGRVHAKMFP